MKISGFLLAVLAACPMLSHADTPNPALVQLAEGTVKGSVSSDGTIRVFKGIPYAAPPVGALRWKAPQPVAPWKNVLPATDFAPRAMQAKVWDDMVFRDKGPSEDCLYLNVWTPMPASPTPTLPVMVWIHGGGFIAGSSSEARQDGSNLARKGVILVSMNYRMGVFGFMAHPELTQESPQKSSGNYGLLDLVACLQWVQRNIAQFGGDPRNITIFGESAGSYAVSALIASPLAKDLFQRAIGQSGSLVDPQSPQPTLADAEAKGVAFAQTAFNGATLEQLRAVSATELLAASVKSGNRFPVTVDGWFMPATGVEIYAAGRQNRVPLMAGWTRDEGGPQALLGNEPPTLANFQAKAAAKFGDRAEAFLKAYAATTDAEADRAARDFGGDQFIALGTWNWLELHRRTSAQPVWRYRFEQPLPLAKDAAPGTPTYAPHASDIEFVFQMLPARPVNWSPDDFGVAGMMASYWTNFAKTGNPNGPDLPEWPNYDAKTGNRLMHLRARAVVRPDGHRARYEFLAESAAKAK